MCSETELKGRKGAEVQLTHEGCEIIHLSLTAIEAANNEYDIGDRTCQ